MIRATLLVTIALAASAASVSAAEPPRDRLAFIVGDWTIEGRETSFREVCEWFPGRSHVICNSESRRNSGTTRGVSVFSYSDDKKRHVYYHYGSSGAVAAMDVFPDGKSLVHGEKIVARSHPRAGGMTPLATMVRISEQTSTKVARGKTRPTALLRRAAEGGEQ